MARMAAGRRQDRARPLARRRLAFGRVSLAWLLAYQLVAQLILVGLGAGLQAAPLPVGQDASFCSGMGEAHPDDPATPHPAQHCLLCPVAGHTPLVPDMPAVSVQPAHGTRIDHGAISRPAPARLWSIQEGARTRAPPGA